MYFREIGARKIRRKGLKYRRPSEKFQHTLIRNAVLDSKIESKREGWWGERTKEKSQCLSIFPNWREMQILWFVKQWRRNKNKSTYKHIMVSRQKIKGKKILETTWGANIAWKRETDGGQTFREAWRTPKDRALLSSVYWGEGSQCRTPGPAPWPLKSEVSIRIFLEKDWESIPSAHLLKNGHKAYFRREAYFRKVGTGTRRED